MKKETPKDLDSIFRNKFYDHMVEVTLEKESKIFAHYFSDEQNQVSKITIIKSLEDDRLKVDNSIPYVPKIYKRKYRMAACVSGIFLISGFSIFTYINWGNSFAENKYFVENKKYLGADHKVNVLVNKKLILGHGAEKLKADKKNIPEMDVKMVNIKSGDEKIVFVLPDSSKVYLNKFSHISFSDKFNEDNRCVLLSGEGFFEIKKSTENKFVVKSGIGVVEVMGTSFYIKSLEGRVEVIVETGEVLVFEKLNADNKQLLIPGRKGILESGKTITNGIADNPNDLSWKTNKIHFDQTPLSEVIKVIEGFYGIKIRVMDSSKSNLHFTGKFARNNIIKDVLETLALSLNASYRFNGNEQVYEINFKNN